MLPLFIATLLNTNIETHYTYLLGYFLELVIIYFYLERKNWRNSGPWSLWKYLLSTSCPATTREKKANQVPANKSGMAIRDPESAGFSYIIRNPPVFHILSGIRNFSAGFGFLGFGFQFFSQYKYLNLRYLFHGKDVCKISKNQHV